MRDLQKDLEWALNKTEFPVVLVHALKRALKAEALARELVEALEETSSIIARWPGPNGRWQAEELADIGRWNELATKAKEVLGDDGPKTRSQI